MKDLCSQTERPLSLRPLPLTSPVLITAGNYSSIAHGHSVSSHSASFSDRPCFTASLDWCTALCMRILNGIFQVLFFFAQILDRWCSKRRLLLGIAPSIPIFGMFPVSNAFARTQGYSVLSNSLDSNWRYKLLQGFHSIYLGVSAPFAIYRTFFY